MREVISEIETRLDEPTARGLAVAVGRAVRDGAVSPGDRLPPIRVMAHELTVSPTTVSAAWSMLSRAGTIRTAGRRGTVVADVAGPRDGRYAQALEHPEPLDLELSTGVPDELLLPSLERVLGRLGTAGTPVSYLDDPVLPDLREVLEETWPCPAPDLTVVDGALDALELVIRTVIRFGDRVVVEHPSFPPLLDLLDAAGADVVGVPLDEDGLKAQELAAALGEPVRAVFIQPRAHNPTGISLSPRRAREIAAVLRTTRALVVEDDSAAGLSLSPAVSLGAELPGQVVHIRSYSKAYGPDLRLAALSGPQDRVGEIRRLRQLGQGWSSRLLQRVLHGLLTTPSSQEEVARAGAEYARRRAAFVGALGEHGTQVGGTDGLNVWVPVHDEAAALVRLATQGVGVAPGKPFSVLGHDGGHVRVTTSLLRGQPGDVDGPERVGELVAAAARTTQWRSRAR